MSQKQLFAARNGRSVRRITNMRHGRLVTLLQEQGFRVCSANARHVRMVRPGNGGGRVVFPTGRLGRRLIGKTRRQLRALGHPVFF